MNVPEVSWTRLAAFPFTGLQGQLMDGKVKFNIIEKKKTEG